MIYGIMSATLVALLLFPTLEFKYWVKVRNNLKVKVKPIQAKPLKQKVDKSSPFRLDPESGIMRLKGTRLKKGQRLERSFDDELPF